MSQFIRIVNDQYINFDLVRKFYKCKDGVMIKYSNGDSEVLEFKDNVEEVLFIKRVREILSKNKGG
jgi:hypothetical protein